MTRMLILTAVGVSLAPGCRDTAAQASAHTPAVESAEPEASARTQYDLATAIDAADAADDPELSYDQIRRTWLGKRYRWSVLRIAPLCRSPERCNVLPFDRGGRDARIVQGWMPRLHIGDAEMKAIEASCGDRARCALEFEATLSDMVLSVDKPTSLGFSDVAIIEAAP